MTDSDGMPHYPVLGLVRRHGKTGAAVIGLGLFALGVGGAWALQFWPCVILGAIVGVLAWGLLLSYVEMVEIIFDEISKSFSVINSHIYFFILSIPFS